MFQSCWGCCKPIVARADVCTTECRPEKPECPQGEVCSLSSRYFFYTTPPLTIIYCRHPPATRYEHIKAKVKQLQTAPLTCFRTAGAAASRLRTPASLPTRQMSASMFAAPRNPNVLLERHPPAAKVAGDAARLFLLRVPVL